MVSSDRDVRAWADQLQLAAIDDPGSLDAAADAGPVRFARRRMQPVVIADGDLPFAELRRRRGDGSQPIVAIVPCHRDDGTPV